MPSPARTSPTAGVHPAIAEPLPGASRHGTAPRLQYLDGLWNHAEGFQITGSDADSGGWFAHDDGTGLQPGDIHLTLGGWVPHTYDNVLSTAHGLATERMQGYLRPAGLALPTAHPRYGNVGTYVDQGAFEIFRPANTPYAG